MLPPTTVSLFDRLRACTIIAAFFGCAQAVIKPVAADDDGIAVNGIIVVDPVIFSISAPVTIEEGDTGSTPVTLTLTRSSGSGEATVAMTYSGDAAFSGSAATGDYGPTRATSRTFAKGETTKTFDLGIWGEKAVEADETITVEISLTSGPSNFAFRRKQTSITIVNDDEPVEFSISEPVEVEEGDEGSTPVTVTLTRSDGDGEAQVDMSYSGDAVFSGSAESGDYGPSRATSRTFADGETSKSFNLGIWGEKLVEPHETIDIEISVVSGPADFVYGRQQTTVTIVNDDEPVEFSISEPVDIDEGDEGSTPVTLTLSRSNGDGEATIAIAYSGDAEFSGSADSGDYGPTRPTTRTFQDGETSVTFELGIWGDDLAELDETIDMEITVTDGPPGISYGRRQTSVTIRDNDTVVFGINGPTAVFEGDSGSTTGTLQITRSKSTGEATVALSFDGTATFGSVGDPEADYGPERPTSRTFQDGESSIDIAVQILGDAIVEPDESILVGIEVTEGPATFVYSQKQGEILILNDDGAYWDWIKEFGLTGLDASPDSDFDLDGLSNESEFVYGGTDPTTPSRNPLMMEWTSEGLELRFVVRNEYPFSLTTSMSLSSFDGELINAATDPQPTDLPEGYTAYVATYTIASGTPRFFRLEAEVP